MKLLLVGVAVGLVLAVSGLYFLQMGETMVRSANGPTLGGGELPAAQQGLRYEAVGYTLIIAAIALTIGEGILEYQLRTRRARLRIREKLGRRLEPPVNRL